MKTAQGFLATLDNPDNRGSSEYRALYELLHELEGEDLLDLYDTVLDEVILEAQELRTRLRRYRR